MRGWVRSKFVEVFGADLRSLAVFRMALGVMVLVDLAYRGTDLPAFYTDGGVPRSVLVQDESLLERWRFSLNLLSGEPFVQSLLFGATAMAALALLFGYSTRPMTIIVWVLMVSIQWRNPLVLNEGDTLLRVLLFWAIFLPLGAYWSADRASGAAPSRWLSTCFLSFATAGLFLQISFVYWFTAILKSGPDWRVDGSAVYYALSVDEWVTPLGTFLYQFPTLLTALTFATIALEAFGSFFLFSPVLTGPVRTGAALAFMDLHFGIWMTMPIGLFSWIAALCMVCFLPSWFWEEALPKLRAMLPKRVRGAPRPPHASWSSLRGRLSSIVGVGGQNSAAGVTANGGDHLDGSAATETAAGEEMRWGATGGDGPTILRPSPVTNLLAALTLVYVFSSNLASVSGFTVPERVAPIGLALSLDQGWSVFAPGVTRYNDWYVIPGTLQNGQQVNLIPAALHNDFSSREGVSWEKPPDVSGDLKNKYWRKYLSSIRADSGEPLRPYFGRYVCREWNARHTGDEQLVDLQLGIVEEMTLPDYQRAEPESTVLLEHTCT